MWPEPKREVPGVYNAQGQVRQCNEGKYDFNLDETSDPEKIIFELSVPKYLDTTALDVDVNPLYVRCVVKEKVTQLKLPSEVRPDASKVQRSRITGILRIEMPLLYPNRPRHTRAAPQPDIQPLQPSPPAPRSAADGGAAKKSGAVNLHGIYKDPRRVAQPKQKEQLLREVKTTSAKNGVVMPGEDDDDDVPPLEPIVARG